MNPEKWGTTVVATWEEEPHPLDYRAQRTRLLRFGYGDLDLEAIAFDFQRWNEDRWDSLSFFFYDFDTGELACSAANTSRAPGYFSSFHMHQVRWFFAATGLRTHTQSPLVSGRTRNNTLFDPVILAIRPFEGTSSDPFVEWRRRAQVYDLAFSEAQRDLKEKPPGSGVYQNFVRSAVGRSLQPVFVDPSLVQFHQFHFYPNLEPPQDDPDRGVGVELQMKVVGTKIGMEMYAKPTAVELVDLILRRPVSTLDREWLFLREEEVVPWFDKHTHPGVLAGGEGEAEAYRLLGEPHPFVWPNERFRRWLEDRSV